MEETTAKVVVDKTGEVLNLLRSPCVDFNRQSEKFWGCLFVPQPNGKFSVMAASQYYCFIAENIDCQPKGVWFDFYDNVWKNESQYPEAASPEALRKLMASEISMERFADKKPEEKAYGNIIFARDNLINWLSEFDKTVIDRSRLIVAATQLKEDEVALRFAQSNEGKVAQVNVSSKIYVDEDSVIPEALIKPAQSYKCKVTGEKNGKIFVNVLEPYGRVSIGIKFSLKAFDPQYMEDWNNLRMLIGEESARAGIFPHNQIISTNAVESPYENWLPIPTHLNTGMVLAGAKLMLLSPNKLCSMRIMNVPNTNVYMETLDSGPDTPKVRIIHTTLNQAFGMQIR